MIYIKIYLIFCSMINIEEKNQNIKIYDFLLII